MESNSECEGTFHNEMVDYEKVVTCLTNTMLYVNSIRANSPQVMHDFYVNSQQKI